MQVGRDASAPPDWDQIERRHGVTRSLRHASPPPERDGGGPAEPEARAAVLTRAAELAARAEAGAGASAGTGASAGERRPADGT